MFALMAEDKDLLTGRWTAINDENVMSHTKVVLTFPFIYGGNHQDDAGSTTGSEPQMIGRGNRPGEHIVFDDAGRLRSTIVRSCST